MTKRLRKPVKKTISVLTAVLAGISVFQIVPIEAEENSYEATVQEDNEKLTVKASAPADTLPEDAKLVVTPIKNDGNDSLYEDTLKRLNEEAEKENKTIDAFIAYDIQFEKDNKETEPVNDNVNVDLKWDNPVKPEGVQDDDQISVVHLKDEDTTEDLNKNAEEFEKDPEKNPDQNRATVKTDEKDDRALDTVSILSDSFSVYTIVWSRDNVSKIHVHYTDENGKEISPTDNVDMPQDAGTDTFAKNIEGYAYSHATVDDVNATEIRTDNGRLSYFDGNNWTVTRSSDVTLVYTAEGPQETAVPEETSEPEPTVTPSTTSEPEEETSSLKAQTEDGKYHVSLTYDVSTLPEGTVLSVTSIPETDEEYNNAVNKVAEARKEQADAFNTDVLNLSLVDQDGNAVTPEDGFKAKVNITGKDLKKDTSLYQITDTAEEKEMTKELDSSVSFETEKLGIFALTSVNTDNKELTGETDHYKVVVSYGEDASIPEGSSLKVTELDKNDLAYKQAKELVDQKEETETKSSSDTDNKTEETLNLNGTTQYVKKFDVKGTEGKKYFSALDITILDKDGNEIEPDDQVNVQITLKKPETDTDDVKDTLSVHHIVKDESSDISLKNVFNADAYKPEVKAVNVKPETSVTDNGGVTADFSTGSFSVYAVNYYNSTADGSVRDLDGRTFIIANPATSTNKTDGTQKRNFVVSSNNNGESLKGIEYTIYNNIITTNAREGMTRQTNPDQDFSIYWTFEKVPRTTNKYYIKAASGVNKGKYLNLDGGNLLSNDRKPLTVTIKTENTNNDGLDGNGTRKGISIVNDDNNACLNADKNNNSIDNMKFATWNVFDDHNSLYDLYEVQTALQTNDHTGLSKSQTLDTRGDITIRMIDYATEDDKGWADGQLKGIPQVKRDDLAANGGINGAWQNDGLVAQGILQRTLDSDGYPVSQNSTSLKRDFAGNGSEEDNKYITDATGLFDAKYYEDHGYYKYSSFDNYAYLNRNKDGTGTFTVYNELGTPQDTDATDPKNYTEKDGSPAQRSNNFFYKRGNFMPYNPISAGDYSSNTNEYDEEGYKLPDDDPRKGEAIYKTEAGTDDNNSATEDYHFGMYMAADFLQLKDGYKRTNANDPSPEPVEYHFNGDDDLWVYVDGVLLLDIGGIHDAHSGDINFHTGLITANGIRRGDQSPTNGYTVYTDIRQQFYEAGKLPNNQDWPIDANGKKDIENAEAKKWFKNSGVQYTETGGTTNLENGEPVHTAYTLADYTSHSFKMFYMERGAGASNLSVKFNLAIKRRVKFYKADSSSKGTGQRKSISGAIFSLKDASGEEIGLENKKYPNDPDNNAMHIFNDDGSDANGLFSKENVILADGDYTLHENSAPNGYNLLPKDIKLYFRPAYENADGSNQSRVYVDNEDSQFVETTTEPGDDGVTTYIVTVYDSGVALPNTGGKGRHVSKSP